MMTEEDWRQHVIRHGGDAARDLFDRYIKAGHAPQRAAAMALDGQ